MPPEQLETANFILNAIQVGGLVGFMSAAIIAFVRGWIYPAAIVDELRQHIKDLTAALTAANAGMERMADAWEARNNAERENREIIRAAERLAVDRARSDEERR